MNEIDFYKNLPSLETDRLILRKYLIEDTDDYFSFASNEEVTKNLRWKSHPNKEYTQEYIQDVIKEYETGKDSPWGIELKEERKLIGSIHIMQLDFFQKKAQIGFVLSKSYWKKGYMTEALNKVIEYCFIVLSLNRIEALCISDNYAAIEVVKKLGLQEEGLLRQYAFQKESFRDFLLLSILKEDFMSKR